MTRREQIEKARWDSKVPATDKYFEMGAEWADANKEDAKCLPCGKVTHLVGCPDCRGNYCIECHPFHECG